MWTTTSTCAINALHFVLFFSGVQSSPIQTPWDKNKSSTRPRTHRMTIILCTFNSIQQIISKIHKCKVYFMNTIFTLQNSFYILDRIYFISEVHEGEGRRRNQISSLHPACMSISNYKNKFKPLKTSLEET